MSTTGIPKKQYNTVPLFEPLDIKTRLLQLRPPNCVMARTAVFYVTGPRY